MADRDKLAEAYGRKSHHEDLSALQKQRFEEAIKLPVVERINHGLLDDVSLSDVKELFKILDMDGNGQLDCDELRLFLEHVMDPPCPAQAVQELYLLTEEASGGRIGPEYFHSAISTGPMRRLLLDVSRQHAVSEKLKKRDTDALVIDKDFMMRRFEWRVSRDESFQTLPFSLVYLMVFVSLVICHLRIWERQQVERAMEGHIKGWGYDYIGPYLQEHLPNLDQYYAWLETSALQFAFGFCGAKADKSVPPEFCEIAPRNMLIADVKFKQRFLDGAGEEHVWLLHTQTAQASLSNHSTWENKTYQAGIDAVAYLKGQRWAKPRTEVLELEFLAYNNEARFFSVNEVLVRFDRYGMATHTAYCWSVPSEAYDRWSVLIADFLYLGLLMKPTFEEVHEVWTSVSRRGFAGFKEYWAFWNVIDWQMIINGICVIIVWIQIVLACATSTLQDLLDADFKLKVSSLSLSESKLEDINDALRYAILLFKIMHTLMAANTIAIMLKFFKAFQANARLQVVTKTLLRASVDIFHFMVVFCAVFNGFVVTGHILLGGDIVHFNSFGASFNTAFLCLMGDFPWYSDLTEQVEPLASGLPYTVVALWFWSFMIIALMILLNMLLAIIMENYATITEELRQEVDAPTIWKQTSRYINRTLTYRRGKFMGLHKVLDELTDEQTNTHPEEEVSKESLLKAIPNMKEEQANYLLTWLKGDKEKQMKQNEDDEVLMRLKSSQAFMGTIAENVHAVSMSVLRCDTKLSQLSDAQNTGATSAPQAPANEPAAEPRPGEGSIAKGISSQLDSQQRVMKELCEQLAKQQRSSENMAKALAEVAQLVPARDPMPPQRPPMVQHNAPMTLPACCGAQADAGPFSISPK